MAKKFLVSIDLNQNELQKAVVHALATAPASGATGQIYFNTSDKKLYQWYDNAWNAVGGSSPSSTTPKMDGTATVGTETAFARGDHIHPSDTSKANGNARIFYGTCSTAAGTSAKVVTCPDYDAQQSGDVIVVKFENANTSENTPTLTVNGTTAKTVRQFKNGSLVNLVNAGSLSGVCMFVLSGSYWVIQGTDDNTTYTTATTSANGLMSSGDKIKLNGIATGAEVNQNAFSNVKVGDVVIAADTKTDTIELLPGNNITLTPDATNDKITIIADDTTYTSGTSSELSNGTVTNQRVWSPKILHDYVSTVVGGVDAMRFKGTVNSNSDLPTTGVKVGDTYMVNTAGTYAGQTCEVGDLIIATATTPTWTVAQTNIDGAVTASSTTSNGYLAKFTGNKVVANGPQLGSSTTTYLRNDGTWATPPGDYTLPAASSSLGGIKAGAKQISAGNTSVSTGLSAGSTSLYGIHAKDLTTDEEVIVDVIKDSNVLKFSINSAYEHNIWISYTYLTS